MTLALEGFKIFLSSPGGLDEERHLFRQLTNEVNEIEMGQSGKTLIPVGWEQNVRGAGRPQERLNMSLESCDYTVFMLADRWGSPTGIDGTDFSSGTEEEYELARRCLVSPDSPMLDILVLFKGVPQRQVADPGPQLRKVLEFKDALEREKALFFDTFDSAEELGTILRRHLHRWHRGGDDPVRSEMRDPPPRSPTNMPQDDRQGRERGELGDALEQAKELAEDGRASLAERKYVAAVTDDQDDLGTRLEYAEFLRREGRLTLAIEISEGLTALAAKRGEVEWEIAGLGNLGVTQRRAGSLARSERSLSKAIDLAARDGRFPARLAYLENNLGLTIRHNGEPASAEGHYRTALAIYDELGDDRGLAQARVNLSYVIREQGRLEEARLEATEALRSSTASPRSISMATCNLGLIAEEEGDLDQAESWFRTALGMNTEMKNDFARAMNLAHLARVQLAQGEESEALAAAGEALDLNQWSGNNEGYAMSLRVIGGVELKQGKYRSAEITLKDARDIYEALDHKAGIALTCVDLAEVFARSGRMDDAKRALQEALTLGPEPGQQVEIQRRIAIVEAVMVDSP